MRRRWWFVVVAVIALTGQPNSLTIGQFRDFSKEIGCNGFNMSLYKDGAWKSATCMDIMEFLAARRDVANVSMGSPARQFYSSSLLYPQYEHDYTLTAAEWKELQTEARRLLTENTGAHPDVVKHWASIAIDKKVPFGLRVKGGAK